MRPGTSMVPEREANMKLYVCKMNGRRELQEKCMEKQTKANHKGSCKPHLRDFNS